MEQKDVVKGRLVRCISRTYEVDPEIGDVGILTESDTDVPSVLWGTRIWAMIVDELELVDEQKG